MAGAVTRTPFGPRVLAGAISGLSISYPAPRGAHPLTGRGTGTFTATQANPDTGTAYKVQGTAQMAALGGPVAVAIDLHTPGNIANGVTTGTLVVKPETGPASGAAKMLSGSVSAV